MVKAMVRDRSGGEGRHETGEFRREKERFLKGHPRVPNSLAYNPYSAYNPRWSCPLIPAANRLKVPKVPIEAREKAYHLESSEGH